MKSNKLPAFVLLPFFLMMFSSCETDSYEVEIDFFPNPIWYKLEVTSGDKKSIIDADTKRDYEEGKGAYFKIDSLPKDRVSLRYIGVNTTYDTLIHLTGDDMVETPFGVKNHYQFEFKYEYTRDSSILPQDTLLLFSNYHNNSSDFKNSPIDALGTDTLYLIVELIGDIAYMGYERYKFYCDGESCHVEKYLDWQGVDTTMTSTITKPSLVRTLKEFENSCLEIPFGGCMSSWQISFIRKNKIVKFSDYSCEWNGVNILEEMYQGR